MNNFKKRLVTILLICVFALTGVFLGEFKNSKADSIEVRNDIRYERNTNLFVDSDGVLQVKRNELGNEPMGKEGTWTIFIYMCGSNLETDYNAASADIKEMISASESDNVNIVIQTGGANKWNKPIIESDRIGRYIIKNNRLELVESYPDANMGDGQTLKSFLSWGIKKYPASNMGVVFWNHGAGTLGGVCADEKYDYDTLSLLEIEKALHDVSKNMTDKFEFVGFDACLMASIETANILVPYANYMYASEEEEPCDGWYYKPIINAMVENSNIDGKELGKIVVDGFIQAAENLGEEGENSTLSVLDLSKVDDVIIAFNDVAKQINEKCVSGLIIQQLLSFAEDSISEGCGDFEYGVVDLYSYMDKISSFVTGTDKVKNSIKNMVVYERHEKTASNANGITIYYPTEECGMMFLNLLRNVIVSPYYMNFIDKMECYFAFIEEDKKNQGFLDNDYCIVDGKNMIDYVPSSYALENYKNNNWENSKNYFDKDYEFMEYFFETLEEYKELSVFPYYEEAEFDDNWFELYD